MTSSGSSRTGWRRASGTDTRARSRPSATSTAPTGWYARRWTRPAPGGSFSTTTTSWTRPRTSTTSSATSPWPSSTRSAAGQRGRSRAWCCSATPRNSRHCRTGCAGGSVTTRPALSDRTSWRRSSRKSSWTTTGARRKTSSRGSWPPGWPSPWTPFSRPHGVASPVAGPSCERSATRPRRSSVGTRPSSPHQDDEFAARLRQRLGDRRTRSDLLSEERQGYREAACLLGSFDPTRLQRVGGGPPGGGVVNLVDDCVALGDNGRTVWTLKPDVREQTLRGLDGVLAARRALAANIGDYGDGPERIAWGYLTGKPPRLEQQDGVQLANTLQVVGWLTLVPGIPDLPVADEVAALRDLRRLLAPLRQLVGVTFQGR